MVLGLQQLLERVGEGKGEPILDSAAGEEMMHVQPPSPSPSAVSRRSPPEPSISPPSTLNQRVMWLSDADRSKGYAVDFLSISLHAVSRDPEAYPSPCIYTQLQINDQRFEAAEE